MSDSEDEQNSGSSAENLSKQEIKQLMKSRRDFTLSFYMEVDEDNVATGYFNDKNPFKLLAFDSRSKVQIESIVIDIPEDVLGLNELSVRSFTTGIFNVISPDIFTNNSILTSSADKPYPLNDSILATIVKFEDIFPKGLGRVVVWENMHNGYSSINTTGIITEKIRFHIVNSNGNNVLNKGVKLNIAMHFNNWSMK